MQNLIQFGFEITKFDAEQRLVEGWATTEVEDLQGDTIPYQVSKYAFAESAQAVGIREMHQPKAVGVLKKWWPDDENKRIGVSVYISKSRDGEDVLTKVKEGVLKGFSIGGRALDWGFEGVKRIIKKLALTEISLVDVPANPQALITVVKFYDGENGKYDINPALLSQNAASTRRAGGVVSNSKSQQERVEKRMGTQKVQKADLAHLIAAVQSQLSEALSALGSDPGNAEEMLNQATAALDVVRDSAERLEDIGSPSEPVSPDEGVDEFKGTGTAVPESSPSSSPSDAAPMSTKVPPTAKTGTPVTGTPVTAKTGSPVTMTTVPSKTPAPAKTVAAESGHSPVEPVSTPTATTEGAVSKLNDVLEALNRVAALMEANAAQQTAPVTKVTNVQIPAGDVPPQTAPVDKVSKALLEGDVRGAIEAAGDVSTLYARIDESVKKSLVSQGISIGRFLMIQPAASKQ